MFKYLLSYCCFLTVLSLPANNTVFRHKEGPDNGTPEAVAAKVAEGAYRTVYHADLAAGSIGIASAGDADNPADNIFHIQIPLLPAADAAIYLQYELFGVSDHTCIARSLNDAQAVGGCLVKRSNSWQLQQERIPVAGLIKGDNVIRFGLPDSAAFSYQVRKISVVVEPHVVSKPEIVVHTGKYRSREGETYLKGMLTLPEKVVTMTCNDIVLPVYKGEFETVITGTTAVLKARLADGALLTKKIVLSDNEEADFSYKMSEKQITAKALFLKGNALSLSLMQIPGLSLQVPGNSLSYNAQFSVTALRDIDLPALNTDMVNVSRGAKGFRFLPHGARFAAEARLTLPFDSTLIPEGYTAEDVRTYFFDEKSREWVALPTDTILAQEGIVRSATTHFTDMINAIIKVPESPQTQGYSPTSIKDIKVADPLQGVQIMAPPVATASGEAAMQFNLKLPEGRQDIQPSLGIRYNNEGGNGWLGVGWNLSTPVISIDTRRGAPRYDTGLETESYLLNGGALSPTTARGPFLVRSAEKRFYMRVEGPFLRIIRHGDHPANYWWEVTDKTGMRSCYGGTPQTGVINEAVLKDGQGNIAQWSLVETRDLDDNFLRYQYETVTSSGLAQGTVPGRQIYPVKISYTGHGNMEGRYTVEFVRDRQLGETERKDISITGRSGFKMVNADLLRKVYVKYNGKTIRSYDLTYREGAFYKTLLENISELDADGKLFYTHGFDYYNDIATAAGQVLWTPEENWSPANDNLKGDISKVLSGFTDEATALGSTTSSSSGNRMAVTLGIYNGEQDKSLTVGGNFTSGNGRTEGLLALVDINGDALPDKVFKKGGQLFYRPNMGFASHSFGDIRPIHGVGNFNAGKSRTTGRGVEVNATYVFFGSTSSSTTSTTSEYFSDFNGDGLVDIAVNGTVYFNRLNETGDPVFLPTSDGTPAPIVNGSNVSKVFFAPDTALQREQERDYPLHDIVRVWVAPHTGNISIQAPVQLVDAGNTALKHDGVRVSIQQSGSVLWSTTIGADDHTVKQPTGVSNRPITKGQRIYFRVQSVYNGEDDLVNWDPVIQYNNPLVPSTDAGGRASGLYQSSADYVLSSKQGIKLFKDGTVHISGLFSKGITADTVTVQIIKESGSTVSVVYQQRFDGTATVAPVSVEIPALQVAANDRLRFVLSSDSYIDRAALHWTPHYQYTNSDAEGIGGDVTPDNSGVNEWARTAAAVLSVQPDTIVIRPLLVLNGAPSGTVVFTVKRSNNIVAKRFIQINNGSVGAVDSIPLVRLPNDQLYFDFHTADRTLAAALQQTAGIIRKDTIRDTLPANLYTIPDEEYLGTSFRGWGHFAFKGTAVNAPLDESRLNTNAQSQYSNDPDFYTDTSLLKNIVNIAEMEFIPLYADAHNGSWVGLDSSVFLTGTQMSSARLWLHDVSVDSLMTGGSIAVVNKVTETKSSSQALGASFYATVTKNSSSSSTIDKLNMFDMNGDKHPDVLHINEVQYTLPGGGLEARTKSHQQHTSTYEGESGGVSLGGSLPVSQALSALSESAANVVASASANIGLSIDGSAMDNDDHVTSQFSDINGDGLPDKVYDNGRVALNLGYSFAPVENWGTGTIEQNTTENKNAGLSGALNIMNGSFQAGFSLEKSEGEATVSFVDVNGDGLMDKVSKGSVWTVQINKGNGLGPAMPWNGLNSIRNSSSTGQSANAAFTITIPIPLIFVTLKICINPGFNSGSGIARETDQLSDIDGDGYADILHSNNDGNLTVYRSLIGRTNMLRGVKGPVGSSFTIDYTRIGNTYDLPQSKYVVSNVVLADGFPGDGIDTLRTRFVYEDGYYDRNEREFYGFGRVSTETISSSNTVYRTRVQEYLNRDYYTRELLKSEWLQDSAGRKFTQTDLAYDVRKVGDSTKFPAMVRSTKLIYEGNATPGVTTSMEFDYDAYGNMTVINDRGDGSEQDVLMASVKYHDNDARYIKSSPSQIEVRDMNGIVRKRGATIDDGGNVTQIRLYQTEDSVATYDMEYDSYGNMRKITRPENYKKQRMWFSYEYDPEVASYVTKITDAFGYTNTSVYDYRFGEVINTVNMQEEPTRYEVDNRGRLVKITGPYEIAAGKPYTIAFEYNTEAKVPYAITRHHDPEHNGDINTVTFADGLGRAVEVKKQAAIFKAPGVADELKMIVSGRTIYDGYGRPVATYYPATEAIGAQNVQFSAISGGITSQVTYDVADRPLTTKLADGAITTNVYSTKDGFLSTLERDALNHSRETLADIKGRKRLVSMLDGPSGIITTRYHYNAVNELLRVVDAGNNEIRYTYDNLGRQRTFYHPDAGTTAMNYDLCGNLTEEITAQIRKEIPQGGAIRYLYDYERRTDIDYPRQYQNKVRFVYGAPGSGDRSGRLILQIDASGGHEFYYGKLGEITKNIRTVTLSDGFFTTYVSEQEYDTWNRIKKITYPDKEIVQYKYNRGGTLDSMYGDKSGRHYSYVQQLGYDQFEQRVYFRQGNGVETYYTYDSLRRRLSNLKALTRSGNTFLNAVYRYDAMSNVSSIVNDVVAQPGMQGGKAQHSYTYDNLYRLTGAEGNYTGWRETGTYRLEMSYDNLYNIQNKKVDFSRPAYRSYNNNYVYGDAGPHQPVSIDTSHLKYDQNGNLISDGVSRNFWDEENRLMAVIKGGTICNYTYDAQGERVVKSHGDFRGGWINGAPAGVVRHDTNYTVYVSPYLVCRRLGFTKHYYVENQRIATKVGIGRFKNISFSMPALTAGGIDYLKRAGQLQRDRYAYYKSLNIAPGPPTDKFFYAEPHNTGIAAPILVDSTVNTIPPGWPGNTTPPATGPPAYQEPIPGNDSVKAGYGFVGTGHFYEQEQYFYHPDHLGSTNYITNIFGEVSQHQEYTAYGEIFFEEHKGPDTQPYKFNGKERDEVTGLYYYGARYYNPHTSIWLSVDPLMDEPEQIEKSPYAYTWNNPVKYTDPDGRCPNCLAAVAGVAIGGVVGGGIEIASQLYDRGTVDNWSAVKGGAAQGAITGAAAGFTGGASLLAISAASGGANAVGGVANRAIQGQETTVSDVATDATVGVAMGAVGGKIGKVIADKTNNLSNAAKGNLGEAITEIRYAARGYKSLGKSEVLTGGKTATGRDAVAKYDHKMINRITGKEITVESKFNTSQLTENQKAAQLKAPGGLRVDRTTGDGLGTAARTAVVGTGAGGDAQRNVKP
ncbi:RHS repeat-associated core domain-containing protein [Chitinophaga sp. YR627]|uniref:SpvB/TcaC N-terminal domain-containing protein n=1 Tax=Chitinophaga sp. YR627 TaxID=1881041 RepID=UPI0008E4E8BE|nr:SpvB/TcaC N-terminal domain-containing protein [Chitinophaga sp. YR627]SFM90299.1 RHS repeat-associated core domain-containing protein [Chitinophaga sp. YR627]